MYRNSVPPQTYKISGSKNKSNKSPRFPNCKPSFSSKETKSLKVWEFSKGLGVKPHLQRTMCGGVRTPHSWTFIPSLSAQSSSKTHIKPFSRKDTTWRSTRIGRTSKLCLWPRDNQTFTTHSHSRMNKFTRIISYKKATPDLNLQTWGSVTRN